MALTLNGCALDDPLFKQKIETVVERLSITTIVETGINAGGSTLLFCGMVSRVIGIENDKECVDYVRRLLAGLNAEIIEGNSPDILAHLAQLEVDASKTLFFLDAHWQTYWPLRDEIAALPRAKGVIVMHDVQIPGTSLGYDAYDGQPLNYAYVREQLNEWSNYHVIEYNSERTAANPGNCHGCPRGVMFVYPNPSIALQASDTGSELTLMKSALRVNHSSSDIQAQSMELEAGDDGRIVVRLVSSNGSGKMAVPLDAITAARAAANLMMVAAQELEKHTEVVKG